jgi:hypothetical protein
MHRFRQVAEGLISRHHVSLERGAHVDSLWLLLIGNHCTALHLSYVTSSSPFQGQIKKEFLFQLYGYEAWSLKLKEEHIPRVKNAVFWDIKTQFIPHRKHITSQLQDPAR